MTTEGKDISQIPKGVYCYESRGIVNDEQGRPVMKIRLCPYWDSKPEHGTQNDGYCHYLERGDWENEGVGLLWDQCKECGVNENWEEIEAECEKCPTCGKALVAQVSGGVKCSDADCDYWFCY